MGTRSVIAIPTGNGTWRGRYAHWDGYPTAMANNLAKIVKRDGLVQAIKGLTEDSHAWSSVTGEVEPSEYALPSEAERFVPGYGVRLADQDNVWITSDSDNWGTEWAYVLTEAGMIVFEATESTGWARRGVVRYVDEVLDDDLTVLRGDTIMPSDTVLETEVTVAVATDRRGAVVAKRKTTRTRRA